MKSLILTLGLLSITAWSDAYNYQRSSTSSSSSTSSGACCQLSPWATKHMDAVRSMADQLRQAYNSRSRGQAARYTNQVWCENLANAIGKSPAEINALSQQLSNQIVSDMQAGRISYGEVAQPNYFEAKASAALEKLAGDAEYIDNQQQQVELYEPVVPHISRPTDLSNFDDVKHFNYPTEVKTVNGQTFITNKNYTTAIRRGGDNGSPYVTTVRVNRTTTHTTVPLYVSQGSTISHPFFNTNDHSIYSHLNKQEVGVPNYSPQVTVDDNFDVGMNQMTTHYTPPIVIPVEGGDQFDSIGFANQFGLRPGHTVTVRKYNRTIITGPDGRPIVSGSESKTVWDNGQIVYNHIAPFGNVSWTKDDMWKREERERLFWVFQGGSISTQELEEWQRNQEERLLALAYRSNKTLEEIEEWQRQELDRYKALINQYNVVSEDLTEWQKRERGRIDWLIHQNGITKEELERWQKENERKLAILAREYHISFEELKEYHTQELNRLYMIFNQQNSQINTSNVNNLHVFQKQESDRLNNILLQHNSTVDQLQEQIRRDQDRYKDLAKQYRINVEDMEKFFKGELTRLTNVINQQQEEMKKITDWQKSERTRLEDVVRHHNLTVEELEQKMKLDRNYLTALAQKYHISMEELEKWQRSELDRLHETGKVNLQKELEDWQQQERARMLAIIKKNDLTIEEYESKIGSDRARLQQLATTYQVQVEEIERWLKEEAQRLKTEGVFSEVQKNLTIWQQQERDRLQAIVLNNEITIEELQNKINKDQNRLFSLANTYQVRVEEVEEWLKKELLRLQSQGLVKKDDLQDWQKTEREKILQLLQENKVTVEDYEKRLLNDKSHLQQLATQYHVELKDIETWLRKESDRLKSLGLIEEEKLTEWQKIERDRILALIQKNELSIEDVQKKIKADQVHLYSLAHRYSVRVEEIEEWLKKEVLRLQNEANIESESLKDWQKVERDRIMMLVKQNDLTIDEFIQKIKTDRAYLHQLAMQYHVQIEEIEEWVKSEGTRLESLGLIKPNAPLTEWQEVELEEWQKVERDRIMMLVKQNDLTIDEFIQKIKTDRPYLRQLAMQYHVQIEEIEEWVKNEGTRLVSLGLIKPNAALTEWQELERDHVLEIVQGQDQLSLDQLEEKLKNDRTHLMSVAQEYQVQVQEIEEWIRKELQRLQNQGVVQIEHLKQWQQTERDHLNVLLAQQKNGFSVDEFERKLKADRHRLQNLAWQNNVQVKEIEEWIHKELERVKATGQEKIVNLTEWQKNERDRLLVLAQQHSDLSAAELEKELQTDRDRLQKLAWQYHIEVEEVEEFIRKEIQRLRDQGKLQLESLTMWQLGERDRLQELIQQQSHLSVEEVEKQLKADRNRLQQLAYQYHIQVEEVEEWIRKEAERLRNQGELHIGNLTDWQMNERKNIQLIIQQNSDLTVEELESQLKADQYRLQNLARQYHVNVEEVEIWIKKELQRLRDEGQLEIENLTAWQKTERERLLQLAQQQSQLSLIQFEEKLIADRRRLEQLANQYHVSVLEIEEWIKKEAERLENQGVIGDLQDWQKLERSRVHNLLKQNNLTVEEFRQELKKDHNRLQQLANQYHITIEEVEEWILNEGSRQIKPEALVDWQTYEKERLRAFNQAEPLTLKKIEENLRRDRVRLYQTAERYHITIEEIEEYIRKEGQRLIQLAPLTVWQEEERQRLLQELQQPQSLTIESLEDQIKTNRYRLQQIAQQYHITIEEVEEWIREEGQRLIRPVQLTEWQTNERERLLQQIQQNHLTLEQLKQQLRTDRGRLQQLANRYHVTIEEIEEWIINQGYSLIKPTPISDSMTAWQQHEREYLLALVQTNHVTLKNFEQHLAQDQMRMENVANHYNIKVQQIIDFLRQEYQRLAKLKQISPGEETVEVVVKEWQGSEQQYIQQLLQEHTWSIEEIERQLRNNRDRLQQLANQYHITITEIEDWYRVELEKLLQKKTIYSENLTDWQKQEKDRLYKIIVDQHVSIEDLQRQLMADRNALKRLAAQYRITIEQLISWHRKELGRMANLGLGKPLETLNLNNWQEAERKRLRSIPVEIIITMEELLEFIESDGLFQNNLTAKYEVSKEDLWKFQGQELQLMKNEGLLETLRLKHLEGWQRRERDRLYNLIRTQSFSSRNLPAWQTNDKMAMIATLYQLPANTIKNWQIEEMQRIEKIAKHYRMTLNALEDFRNNEIERLKAISHKDFLSEFAFMSWEDREENRLRTLTGRLGLSGAQLDKWRRKLYLLAQGLIDLDFDEGGYGGIELNTNTSASGRRNETISSDRGDQPPQVYQEEFEDSEPQLGNPSDQNAPIIEMPTGTYLPSRPDRPHHGYGHGNQDLMPPHGHFPPSHEHGPGHGPGHGHGHGHGHGPGPGYGPGHGPDHGHGHGYGPDRGHGYGSDHGPGPDRIYSERTHRKKEYTFTAPVDVPVVSSNYNYQGRYSLGRGPSYGNMNAGDMTHDVEDDLGQQQVQVEDWNSYVDDNGQKSEKFEDIGQHPQMEMSKFTQEDLGQQQQEELGHFTEEGFGHQQVQHGNYQHSQHQVENPSHTSSAKVMEKVEKPIVTAEPVTEKTFSWKKPTTWFG